MLGKARKFTDNTHLSDSLKITIAAVVPFLISIPYEAFDLAFAAAIGAMLTAPVDIPSNKKDKIIGLLAGAITVPTVTLLLSVTHNHWYFYPIFTVIVFSLGMISIYGHRANLLSFTGLLAVSLALAHDYEGTDLLLHCLMLLAGGLFYLLVALVFNLLRPQRYAVLQTSECIELTAKYLRYRAQLWDKEANLDKITQDQLTVQISLNEVHENLREYLVRNRANTGNSSNNRRLLVAFSILVEILEIALSNTFEHSKLHQLFNDKPELIKRYQRLAYHFADTIDNLAYAINLGTKYQPKDDLLQELSEIQKTLSEYVDSNNSDTVLEAVVMFTNVIQYAESQIHKIHDLEKVLSEKTFSSDVEEKFKDLEKFLTPVHYRFETLKENLTFTSTIFRHSLRLTLTILTGLIISEASGVLNGYWILLTIVVIMRPGYGLTKQRSFERVIGTVLGGLIAIGLLYLIPSTPVIASITVLTMIIGYWASHTDYKVGVTFITMYVVLIYGLLTPDFMNVMTYRVIDTVIGALLAFGANYLLWPSWEFLNLNVHLKKSIEANKKYLEEISLYYNDKGEVTLPYKLARKYAFIEIGNLMASFQRMIQEPKSKQKFRNELYELVVLNNTFLSTAASIGIYIQSNSTTKASEAFNVVMDYTINNLELTLKALSEQKINSQDIIERTENFNISFSYLKGIREYELKKSYSDDKKINDLMKESVLVIEQLFWLSSLSEKIFKLSAGIINKKREEQDINNLTGPRKKIIH